jgi:hypothetical protein
MIPDNPDLVPYAVILFENAAKAVEALIDDQCGDTEKRLIRTCALAVRGESLAWCELHGVRGLRAFEKFYDNLGETIWTRLAEGDAE